MDIFLGAIMQSVTPWFSKPLSKQFFYLIKKRKGYFKKMRGNWGKKRLRKPGFLLLPLTDDTVTLGEPFAFLGP